MHLHPYTLIYAILLLFLLQSSNGIHKEGFNPNSLKYFHCCLLLPDLGLINHLSCLMCGSRIYQELAKFNRRNSFLEKWVRCHANYQSQMEAQPPVAKWVLLGRPYGLPIANHQVAYQMICQKMASGENWAMPVCRKDCMGTICSSNTWESCRRVRYGTQAESHALGQHCFPPGHSLAY